MHERVAVLLCWVSVSACVTTHAELVPSLTPIDASRPFVIHPVVTANACGANATAAAVTDLFRVGAHGFVTAVIERDERTGCVTISAHPITYGCDAEPPRKLDEGVLRVVPGPVSCPASTDTCTPDCTRLGTLNGGGDFENRAIRERCISRCRANDAAFLACARAATTAADVKKCDSLAP